MALDITIIASQVSRMVDWLKERGPQKQRQLANALSELNKENRDIDALKKKINASKTSWLVAELVEGLNNRHDAPPAPKDFAVLATDGSQVETNRHQAGSYYCINIGGIALEYGQKPNAILESQPTLFYREEDMAIRPASGNGRHQPIDSALLGIKRDVEECRHLVKMAAKVDAANPTLALLDGSLLKWLLEGKNYPDFVADELLDNGFLACLEEMRKLFNNRVLTLASYISFPGGTDVTNALRVAACPHAVANCDKECSEIEPGQRACDFLNGIRDRDLFENLLKEGQRSALFISPSRVSRQRYGQHQVYFFYLKVAEEVARVEIPQWVALNSQRLGLTHTLILDQCQRGHGYPVTLSEAHEQAVVTGKDREQLQKLVELSMTGESLPFVSSAKSRSKKTRWV